MNNKMEVLIMFEVTEEASCALKEFLVKRKSKQAIRIILQAG